MFIKVTRLSSKPVFQMLIPASDIKSVFTGYEKGSRVLMAETRVEIEVDESVDEIYAQLAGTK